MLVLRGRHLGPGQSDRCLPWFTDLHVGITKRLKNVEVLEGESCNFECILSHEDTGDTATWTVGGKTLGSSGRFRATRQGRKYILAVREALLSDTGEVVFSVRGLTSKASLLVRGGHHAPKQMGHSPQATCSGSLRLGSFRVCVCGGFWGLSPSATGGGPELRSGCGVSGHLGAGAGLLVWHP